LAPVHRAQLLLRIPRHPPLDPRMEPGMTDLLPPSTAGTPADDSALLRRDLRPRRRVPTWLRVLLPAVLILAWLTAAGFGGPLFGKVGEVSSNDQTSYLPESADATQVQALLGEFQGD